MITRVLLFIKHRLPWLWQLVEWLNAHLYSVLHRRAMLSHMQHAFTEFTLEGFIFRPVDDVDLPLLAALLERQGDERLRYFRPHGFDVPSLRRMMANPAFLMFGVWDAQGNMVGYFFLRCFWNRRCFVGRLIDQPSEGKGIGRVMNQIMYHTAWWSGFRCMTTISKHNQSIIRSHKRNPYVRVAGQLSNDYVLVEFLEHPPSQSSSGL